MGTHTGNTISNIMVCINNHFERPTVAHFVHYLPNRKFDKSATELSHRDNVFAAFSL